MNHTLRLLTGLLFFLLFSCNGKPSLFRQVASSHSGITFNNKITENDSINPLDIVNIYNGGGVGIGDFNNDGLQDVYFTGNMDASRLYLNKGNLEFTDITSVAGVEGKGRWARGVSVVDINSDGLMDMYVCNTIYKDSLRRRNILYINKGVDKQGIPHFEDMAAAYGLDIHVQSTMGYFFDYDNDGDLDMYLVVNEAAAENQNKFGKGATAVQRSTGRLYRNNAGAAGTHPLFEDVSEAAGINLDGYGHAATIADINLDGWKDIYVSDDFLSNNILYINNGNGTFTNQTKEYFKHTSFNSMGQDIIDVNNDGLADVLELDMNPRDNYRKKMMLGPNNYNTIQNFERYGHQYQYVRNTLQLNQGPRPLQNDSSGPPVFSETGFMSGISQTDWSWTPLICDFDNDGYRDLVVTNGFPRDVSDHDFMSYRSKARGFMSSMDLMEKIPEIKLVNYAFKNDGEARFTDVSKEWGFTVPSFSNGAAWADLDNDGDLDMLVNNINDAAFLYQNTTITKDDTAHHYLQVQLQGPVGNLNGLGAFVSVYCNGKQQVYENSPYRGYLSSNQSVAHFGLGNAVIADSVVVQWPGAKKQVIIGVKTNQVLKMNIANAVPGVMQLPVAGGQNALFKEITNAAGISYVHQDNDFIDFNIQTTLPHKLSEYCPALAVADLNGDGLDDLLAGGTDGYPATALLQQADGKFTSSKLTVTGAPPGQLYKDEGILAADFNGDGYTDLYMASGGYGFKQNSPNYQDRLYINDGKGSFTFAGDALPVNYTSKFCVRATDYNKDGKLDIFVAGRVLPGKYPQPVSSFIFRNDTENGKVKFTDVTASVAPALQNIGMLCDALFTDFDGDGQQDLLLAGEWMPVIFLKNTGGRFTDVTAASGIQQTTGWWNTIVAGDFRHTGRTDYIIGNTGLNTLYQPTDKWPVFITAKDFDNNGSYAPITSLYLPAVDGSIKEFPAFGRDDIIERIPTMKKRFDNYQKFAEADMEKLFPPNLMKGAQRLQVNNLQSCFLRNDGNGHFTIIPLPQVAQVSVLNGMIADDFNADGNLDLLINGNEFGLEVGMGRQDALNGLLLQGDGKGGFAPLSLLQSGIYIPGDGKALVKLRGSKGQYLVAASQHRGALQLYELKTKKQWIQLHDDDIYATIRLGNGTLQKEEFYYGTSFLSQSGRFCPVNTDVSSIIVVNNKGISRKLSLKTTLNQ